MKKRKKKLSNKVLAKRLFNKAEKLAKKVCQLRDKNVCQLHKHYPSIGLACAGYLQADHGITRACKKYYLDPRNLTWVCGSANRAKHYKVKSADECIRQIVIDREGQEFWDEMVRFNMSQEPFLEWGKVWWLEECIAELETMLQILEIE